MNVGNSVRKAIDDWGQDDLESAMLHACNAVDGTAKKVLASISGNNARFTQFLRDNYGVLGPMGAPGIDLERTRFPVRVDNPKAIGGKPDIADVIYGVHRCGHGHGAELPDGFDFFRDAAGPPCMTHLSVEKGRMRLSDRMIFGLLGVVVLSPANGDQRVPEGYFLTFALETFPINDWWGRVEDFLKVAAAIPTPQVRLDFTDWMDSP